MVFEAPGTHSRYGHTVLAGRCELAGLLLKARLVDDRWRGSSGNSAFTDLAVSEKNRSRRWSSQSRGFAHAGLAGETGSVLGEMTPHEPGCSPSAGCPPDSMKIMEGYRTLRGGASRSCNSSILTDWWRLAYSWSAARTGAQNGGVALGAASMYTTKSNFPVTVLGETRRRRCQIARSVASADALARAVLRTRDFISNFPANFRAQSRVNSMLKRIVLRAGGIAGAAAWRPH